MFSLLVLDCLEKVLVCRIQFLESLVVRLVGCVLFHVRHVGCRGRDKFFDAVEVRY